MALIGPCEGCGRTAPLADKPDRPLCPKCLAKASMKTPKAEVSINDGLITLTVDEFKLEQVCTDTNLIDRTILELTRTMLPKLTQEQSHTLIRLLICSGVVKG